MIYAYGRGASSTLRAAHGRHRCSLATGAKYHNTRRYYMPDKYIAPDQHPVADGHASPKSAIRTDVGPVHTVKQPARRGFLQKGAGALTGMAAAGLAGRAAMAADAGAGALPVPESMKKPGALTGSALY